MGRNCRVLYIESGVGIFGDIQIVDNVTICSNAVVNKSSNGHNFLGYKTGMDILWHDIEVLLEGFYLVIRTIAFKELVDRFRLFLLSTTMFYIFCFQYVFFPINGILSVLGGFLLVTEVLMNSYKAYKGVSFVFIFIGVSFVFGLIFAYDMQLHLSLSFQILKYCIIMVSICGYASTREKLITILVVISFSVFVLAMSLLINGEEFATYGAITVGDLNPNVLSCYLMVGLISQFLLLCHSQKRRKLIVIYLMIITELIVQVLVASRRGLVLFVFLLVMHSYVIYSVWFKRNVVGRFVIILALGMIVCYVLINFYNLANRFVVFQRFLGKYNSGDALREYYQDVALQLFLENPVFGQGFGCVSAKVGMYSHSLYCEVLASCGTVGILLLICPILRRTVSAFKYYRKSKNDEVKMICMYVSSAFIALLMTGIAVVEIFDAWFYLLLGLLGAILNNIKNQLYEIV